ncbi:hypothetical protein TL16_g11685 [Triparma laevis f. inornata]|uniref:RING-type domain-containing protein n=2 Tax=Triparma laevis TaxID=1534972 RepID=A0A9W7EC47_9STRA|nr:hypothetical protein TrLO_g3543 [Triparma laevis f. longispina]GMH90164.1 hypothetical protein TL16_g11685 [Triparma laevis f. inornata]
MDVSPPPPKICAICQTSSADAHAQNLTFKTSKIPSCYHLFCLPCLKQKFSKSGAFPCPSCPPGTFLNPAKLTSNSVDTLYCSTDASWRSRVLGVYNKRESDFSSDLKGWNDYLEEVEDIIYTICNEYYTEEGLKARSKIKNLELKLDSNIITRQLEIEEDQRRYKDEVESEKMEQWKKRNVRDRVLEETGRLIKEWRKERNEVELGERDGVSERLVEAKVSEVGASEARMGR